MTIDQAARERAVSEAVHSAGMEGLTLSDEALADAELYVVGEIDVDELIHRAHMRHGLN
jgi:hypothetical protein